MVATKWAGVKKGYHLGQRLTFKGIGLRYGDCRGRYQNGALYMTTVGELSGSRLTIRRRKMASRAEMIPGKTYKLRPPQLDVNIYITINDAEVGGVLRPVEIFANSKHVESLAWVSCLTRIISKRLQEPGDFPLWVVHELRGTIDPRGGYLIPKTKGAHAHGVVSHIGYILEQHCKELGVMG